MIHVLAMLGALALAQDGDLCGDCKTTGKIDSKFQQAKDPLEADCRYCSEFMKSDPVSLGLGWYVCPRCKAPAVQAAARAEFDNEFAARKKWLDERAAENDTLLKHEMVHVQTRHFTISWGVPSIKVDRRVLRAHEAAHLYAERAEKLFADLVELHGLNEGSMRLSMIYISIPESPKDEAILRQHRSNNAGLVYGNPGLLIDWYNKTLLKKDEEYHQHFVHMLSHLIHFSMLDASHWMVERYGWMQEGLAHYCELRWFDNPNTWCYREASAQLNWSSKGWEANVKKALLTGEAPVFEEFMTKPSDALDAREHQFSWSYVDYLIWLDPKRLPKLIALMKGPQLPVRECLQQSYGLSIPAFIAGWEEFVRTQYSSTPKKGPQPREPRPQPKEESK